MRFLQLVKNSILHFNELKNAKNIGFGKMILYLLLLSLIAAIPITLQVRQVFSDIQSDGQEIAEQIPDFTVEDGKCRQMNKMDLSIRRIRLFSPLTLKDNELLMIFQKI